MPLWEIDDNRCQLCFAALGTAEHRFDCDATRPAEGWSQPPKEARHALEQLGPTRRAILRKTGLAALRLPRATQQTDGWFSWTSAPPDVCREDLRWYTDGSASDPT